MSVFFKKSYVSDKSNLPENIQTCLASRIFYNCETNLNEFKFYQE